MNQGQIIGIVLIVAGLGLALIGGAWLFTQVEIGGALLGAFLLLIPVALQIGFGVFLFTRGGQEAVDEKEREKQRELMDMIMAEGEVRVRDVAVQMGISVDDVKAIVHRLVGLQVFSGYINWDKGVLYSAEASNLRDLKHCENCGGEINLTGKGVAACPFCGTEYFLS